jgi:hypothetical protein
MPFAASDLLWWEWFLCSIGCGVVGGIAFMINEKKESCLGILIAFSAFLCAFGCFVIGAIRFVKWIWYS